jgi:hypothetical protein
MSLSKNLGQLLLQIRMVVSSFGRSADFELVHRAKMVAL